MLSYMAAEKLMLSCVKATLTSDCCPENSTPKESIKIPTVEPRVTG